MLTLTLIYYHSLVDTEAPAFSNCPSSRFAILPQGSSTVIVTWNEPTATDNNVQIFTSQNYYSGNGFQFGTATVTYTFTDQAGNSATCTFTVTVSRE